MRTSRVVSFFSVLVSLAASLFATRSATTAQEPQLVITPVLELASSETVFAYARVSPDGTKAVFTLQDREQASMALHVVDLSSERRLFVEPGIDGYWSPEGDRVIYRSGMPGAGVSILHMNTGFVSRRIGPESLGDYPSWGLLDGRDVILTIDGEYYFRRGDIAEADALPMEACPDIGVGDRPLLSKDGTRVSVFVNGSVVVRNLMGCDEVFFTGELGAKADFSFDGRYIAFHSPRLDGFGYEIKIVDLEARTVRTLSDLEGSSFYPSWTRDGRIFARNERADFRGFVLVDNVLSLPPMPLSGLGYRKPVVEWSEAFPHSPLQSTVFTLVLVWAPWNLHAFEALQALQDFADRVSAGWHDVTVFHAVESGIMEEEVARILTQKGIAVTRIHSEPDYLLNTMVHSQNPTFLLFANGMLVDWMHGNRTLSQLSAWVDGAEVARDMGW